MTENYFNLKRKLEGLGYNSTLPLDAVPLVESVFADLLQTTRSLQHYMDLSKEAITQRDRVSAEIEPYKCDNAKLIQANNVLHKDLMIVKEANEKQNKESVRKIKLLTEEVMKKDSIITKLQHELRELSLRGLCAGTLSSRNKSKRKDCGDVNLQKSVCTCNDNRNLNIENDILEYCNKIESLEQSNNAYADEIVLLKNQIEYRDNEIVRLNILLEGGRPVKAISNDFCNLDPNKKVQELQKQLYESEAANVLFKKELDNGLQKQHEAMLRALNLADHNKCLKDELAKVDAMALRVEEESNKKISSLMHEVNCLQSKVETMTRQNVRLENLTQNPFNELQSKNIQECLNKALKEKDLLQQELKDLSELNKGLQNKILELSQNYKGNTGDKVATRDDMQTILEAERKIYEQHLTNVQQKLTDTINCFERHLSRCKNKETVVPTEKEFIKDLHNKLCESEQKILMLQKENEDLQSKIKYQYDNSKQNYKDIICQLNAENSELLKENLSMSRKLSHYKNVPLSQSCNCAVTLKRDINKMESELEKVKQENEILCRDKQEYKSRYKEYMDIVETLKRDLFMKQKQVDQLEEENCSYKMTNRTGKASTEHLKDECNFLREQIKRMQTDVIKEKTIASQIKNIQIETERSNNEFQSELVNTQRQLSQCKNTIDILEQKCNELQSELMALKAEKSNLIENIKKVDKERDHLVIELDHKTETICVLEQKLKSQIYDSEKLEKDIVDLTRKLNLNKISEHKLVDYDSQIKFLNGEISKLNLQLDNAVVENKQFQNSLADVNGTLKITKIEYEKSRKEVGSLKEQLQHYVAEIRRIEELLSHKEAERSDMLEHFASLSVEANILENTNHSLESESASKSLQLQSYISKIQEIESNLLDKDKIIDGQAARIASMTCKISSLESEIKLINEEKDILEKNVQHLKRMCGNLQTEKSHIVKGIDNTDSELKLYENKIKSLANNRTQLEADKVEMKETLHSTEKILSNARKEIVDLKLALQDAISETKTLQEENIRLKGRETDFHDVCIHNISLMSLLLLLL